MDLRRLEYFLAVVGHGQVTSAAAALRVAQPSLSQAIKALERDLGVELFTREGRTLRPTRAGRALIEPARRVLGDLDTARAAVSDVVELASGWLDIAAHDLLARDPVVAALATFHQRYAGIPVRLHPPRDEDDLMRLLADGTCELGLAFLPLPDAGLTVRRLGTQEIWVVLPPGSRAPRRQGAPVPIGDLHEVAFVDSMRGFASPRGVIAAALREEKTLIRPVVRTRHRESIIPMVVAGVGGAFTTAGYAREAARAGAVARPLDPSVTCDFALVHRDATLSPAARAFVRVLLDTVGGQADPSDLRTVPDQAKQAGRATSVATQL
jgi:DNA-binding transcriptional LysR family regulator